MWKWTDPEAINCIIIDDDSTPAEELDHTLKELFPYLHIIHVSQHQQSPNSRIYVEVFDLLQEILAQGQKSFQVVSVSSNMAFLKAMSQNHIGTIQFGNDFLQNLMFLPDFQSPDINSLSEILSCTRSGYAAEVIALYGQNRSGKQLFSVSRSIESDSLSPCRYFVFFGGRYFPLSYRYLANDPLSSAVLEFKRNYVYPLDIFYDSSILFLQKKYNFDCITFIPPKPHQDTSENLFRFEKLSLPNCRKSGIELSKILISNQNTSQKTKNARGRCLNAKGSFYILDSNKVKGKRILILDDVYTTGSTIHEAAKVLYSNGAAFVCALTAAVNQPIRSSLPFSPLTCPFCGAPMRIYRNSMDGTLFFGCSQYKIHPDKRLTLNLYEGWVSQVRSNSLSIAVVPDIVF